MSRRFSSGVLVVAITLAAMVFTVAVVVVLGPSAGVYVNKPAIAFSLILPALIAPAIALPLLRSNRHLRKLQAELDRLARTDELTGLPNRRAFFEHARAVFAVPSGAPAAVFMVDIDFFKHVNDTFGHDAGDAALREVGRMIHVAMTVAKAEDAFAARIGGEEFAALIVGLAPSAVARLADRICADIRQNEVSFLDKRMKMTVSVGVAFRAGDLGVDAVMRSADSAVYQAKHGGRDRWSFAGPHAVAPIDHHSIVRTPRSAREA